MVGIRTPVPKNARSKANRQISAEELANSEPLGSGANVALGKSHTATSAVNASYKDNYTDLCNYASSFLHSQELAQDCVHQAFASTLATVRGGQQIKDMRGFLVSCVRNNCLSHLRKSKRESSYSLNEDFIIDDDGTRGESSSADTSVEIKARWRKVKGAIDDLPHSQRSALLMAEFQGYSYSEIANRMHRSDNSVRQLITRARKKVKATAVAGADWTMIPAPAIEVERMLTHSHFVFSPNIPGVIQAKTSQLQTWIGSLLQEGADNVLHPATAVATGATIVALAATSPAPPTYSVPGGHVVESARNAPALTKQPASSSSSRFGRTESSSGVVTSQSENDANTPGPTLVEEKPPATDEGKVDTPGPTTPDKGRCGDEKSGKACGSVKPEDRGQQEATGNNLPDSPSNNATAHVPATTDNSSCSVALAVTSCIKPGKLASVGPRTDTVSVGRETSSTADQQILDGSSASGNTGGTTDNGLPANDTLDTSLGSADNNGSISPFTSVKMNSVEEPSTG